jgi:hypothetical protein
MVTDNIDIDLDITNGARGEIVDITVLYPDEPPSNLPVVHLQYMPLYILVKLTRTRATPFGCLQDNVIKMLYLLSQELPHTASRFSKIKDIPCKRLYNANSSPSRPRMPLRTTALKGRLCQMSSSILHHPPTGTLNLYVALSRNSGHWKGEHQAVT